MSGRRSRVGRMDAAIDHFAPMGYKETQVRSVVNSLLKVYGNAGWPLLEGDCYEVVQEELFKQEEEEEKLQLQKQKQQLVEDLEEEGGSSATRSSDAGGTIRKQNAILRVHTDVPSEAVLAVDEKEEVVPMIIDAPALRDMLPHPLPAVIGRTGRPCHGWISESESDSDYEEHFGNRQLEVHVPTRQLQEETLCKTKRPRR